MTLCQIESQLFLDHISDGYVTDDFTTAGVVSGTVATPSLVNVHVACIYTWNNTTICTLMSLVLWVLCTINIVFQIRPFVSNLFDKNL